MGENFSFPDDCECRFRWFDTTSHLLIERPLCGRAGLRALLRQFPQVAPRSDYGSRYGIRVTWATVGLSKTRRWGISKRTLATMQRSWGDMLKHMLGGPVLLTIGDGYVGFEVYPEEVSRDVAVCWVVLSYAMWSSAWAHTFHGRSTGWAGLKNRLALVHKTGPLEDAVIEYCHGQLRQYERGIKPKPSRISEALLVGDKGSIPAK